MWPTLGSSFMIGQPRRALAAAGLADQADAFAFADVNETPSTAPTFAAKVELRTEVHNL